MVQHVCLASASTSSLPAAAPLSPHSLVRGAAGGAPFTPQAADHKLEGEVLDVQEHLDFSFEPPPRAVQTDRRGLPPIRPTACATMLTAVS